MNPSEIHSRLVERGLEAARSRAYATACERLRKQIRAKWTVHYLTGGATLGKAGELALLESEYISACEASERAEEEAGAAAVHYDAAKSWLDIYRTQEATKRAEMNLR